MNPAVFLFEISISFVVWRHHVSCALIKSLWELKYNFIYSSIRYWSWTFNGKICEKKTSLLIFFLCELYQKKKKHLSSIVILGVRILFCIRLFCVAYYFPHYDDLYIFVRAFLSKKSEECCEIFGVVNFIMIFLQNSFVLCDSEFVFNACASYFVY